MNKNRKTSHILNVFQYDHATGIIGLNGAPVSGYGLYLTTNINDGSVGIDSSASINALYLLKNTTKQFEISYDTSGATKIFRLLPYQSGSSFQIGNPSNAANSNTDYVFISESVYGNVLIGPGIGNAVTNLTGATAATHKIQFNGAIFANNSIQATSFKITGGASTGFLKADGTVDAVTYLSGNQSITVSGDATGSGTTAITLTLANTAVTPGTYGSTTLVPVVTVDSKGRITSVTTAAISGSLTFTGDVTGTGTTGTSTGLTLAASGVTAGTYTKVTVDSKGRVTVGANASTTDISEGTNLYYTDARVGTYLTANSYATQSYVGTQVANLVAAAPATLDTLNELAAALGNDPSFATTVSTSIGTKVPQTRTLTINGTGYDLSADRSWTINSMVYPGAGIALSTGTAWGTSITDNSANWNTAYGWGNHASGGYLTSATAATTYASLTGAYANPAFISSLAYSKITGVPAFLTSYTETDPYRVTSVAVSGTSTKTITLTRADASTVTTTWTDIDTDTNTYVTSAGFSGGTLTLTRNDAGTVTVSLDGRYYLATNPSGYITGITSGNVTTALGYTPYNSTNPSGYISSYTETDTLATVTGRGSSTTAAISAANFQVAAQVLNLDTVKTPGLYHYDGAYTGTQPVQNWYNVRTIEVGNSTRASQFVMPYSADRIFYRRNTDSGWQPYVELYHTGNIPTWNQNTTGTAANSTLWNGAGYSYTATSTVNSYILGLSANGDWRPMTTAAIQSWLGLGSLAYSSATIPTNNNQLTNGAGYITSYTETDTLSSVVGRGASTSTGITINPNGTSITMGGGGSAEGIRMQASTSTTYPVFLRSVNPSGGGETSAWLFKEDSTPWGIWHNNPINTFDFTSAGSGGIAQNVGGGTNQVMVRIDPAAGYVQTASGFKNSAGTVTLDNSGNISGNAATVTNGVYTTGDQTIGGVKTFSSKIIVGTFANSTTNTGEAWFGRASDRNLGTYTIQLGGNSASNRQFEVVDYGWSTVLFSVGSNGNIVSSGTISASNYSGTHSGSSSGTNTGDQTNISGSAGSAGYAGRIQTGNNQWTWSTGAHTATNPNTITLWDQYSDNGGGGYPWTYGTIVDIYGRSAHEHDQFFLNSDGNMYHRNCFYGTNSWNAWRAMLDSSNYNTFSPTLTGGGASGTWGINISGNAATATSATSATTATTAGTATSATSATSATQVVTIQDSAPGGAAGKLWWESDTGKLKVYYGSAWVDASPIPDSSLFFAKAGGSITGDVSIGQTLNVVGNTLVQGTISAFGDVIAYSSSDARLKDNITAIESPLEKVCKINGVSFNWNDKQTAYEVGKKDIGVIAQEVEEVLPELVTTRDNGYKAVRYEKIVALLIEAVKEQQTQINNLTDKLNNL